MRLQALRIRRRAQAILHSNVTVSRHCDSIVAIENSHNNNIVNVISLSSLICFRNSITLSMHSLPLAGPHGSGPAAAAAGGE
jgi:hypothetical protein